MYMRKLEGVMREKKLSRKKASYILNISEPTFRKYIRDEGFSIKQIKTLSDALHLSPDETADIFLN